MEPSRHQQSHVQKANIPTVAPALIIKAGIALNIDKPSCRRVIGVSMRIIVILLVVFLSVIGHAAPIPKMGDIYAESHQKCGKKINILIGRTIPQIKSGVNSHVVLGITNKKTKSIDYFYSESSAPDFNWLAEYRPVKFNTISGGFEPLDAAKPLPNIWWGHTEYNYNYTLSIGEHTYECGPNLKYVDESANSSYGD